MSSLCARVALFGALPEILPTLQKIVIGLNAVSISAE
jgi:hypothetical protein